MNIERLFIIDRCLSDTSRQWTLQDLIDQCGEVLQNSRRSVQYDLEVLRKHFNAPVAVVDKRYYTYSDPDFRLQNVALGSDEIAQVERLLIELRDYSRFEGLQLFENDIVKLHDKIAAATGIRRPRRHLENEILEPRDIRLWVCEEMMEEIIAHPLHPTQQIEQYEIDGSAIIVIHTVLTAKLDQWVETLGNRKVSFV